MYPGEMVAWCTKEGHGTRIIPEGALQGVQFIQVRLASFYCRQVVDLISTLLHRRLRITSRSSVSLTRSRSTCFRTITVARW